MDVFRHKKSLSQWVRQGKARGMRMGFVPTMGALHAGHLELVGRALKENDLVVCSIFVNPIQFNKAEDLEKYPRSLEADLRQLEDIGCDAVFCPDTREMYPEKDARVFDFGHLDKVMEGRYREGHFNGVAIVVDRLFRITEPDKAYFGEKDFQQLQIIRAMVRMEGHPVAVVGCPTVREPDGLALSSRNARLTKAQREEAPGIYQALQKAREMFPANDTNEIIRAVTEQINASPELELEYFEIVKARDLLPATAAHASEKVMGCIAVHAGDVRLIDNLSLNS